MQNKENFTQNYIISFFFLFFFPTPLRLIYIVHNLVALPQTAEILSLLRFKLFNRSSGSTKIITRLFGNDLQEQTSMQAHYNVCISPKDVKKKKR